ncbi:unnamed protein product, partial [Gulo gulo]
MPGLGRHTGFTLSVPGRENTVSGSGLTEGFPRRSSPGSSPPRRGSWKIPDSDVSWHSRLLSLHPSFLQAGAPFSG